MEFEGSCDYRVEGDDGGIDGNSMQVDSREEGDHDQKQDDEILDAMGNVPKKRKVQRDVLKLNEVTLTNDKTGLVVLPRIFDNFSVPDAEDEFKSLNRMMNKLEHWAHCLFPALPFDDVLARVENLGPKKTVQTQLTKLRMGMALTDEDFTGSGGGGEQSEMKKRADEEGGTEEPDIQGDDEFPDLDDIFPATTCNPAAPSSNVEVGASLDDFPDDPFELEKENAIQSTEIDSSAADAAIPSESTSPPRKKMKENEGEEGLLDEDECIDQLMGSESD